MEKKRKIISANPKNEVWVSLSDWMRSSVKEVGPRAGGMHERCPSQDVCMMR